MSFVRLQSMKRISLLLLLAMGFWGSFGCPLVEMPADESPGQDVPLAERESDGAEEPGSSGDATIPESALRGGLSSGGLAGFFQQEVPPLIVEEGGLLPGRPAPLAASITIRVINLNDQRADVQMTFGLDGVEVHRTFLRIPGQSPPMVVGPELTDDVRISGVLADGTPTATVAIIFNENFIGDTTRDYVIVPGAEPAATDSDGDGRIDLADNCPSNSNSDQADSDGDGLGDACDSTSDADGDGVLDGADNCPAAPNVDQTDADSDGIGDVCDIPDDADNDGVADDDDNCRDDANADQADADGDGIGDACDESDDADEDGVSDDDDNCVETENADQADADEDGIGDACDDDIDGDGILNDDDNCPEVANAPQTDNDADGAGNECDDTPNGVVSPPPPPPTIADCNGNGIPDAQDLIATGGPGVLYGGQGGEACDAILFTLDPTTGMTQSVANFTNLKLGPVGLTGLTATSDGRTLYAAVRFPPALVRFDTLTQQVVLVGEFLVNTIDGSTPVPISALALLPDGRLIGSAPQFASLVEINTADGEVTHLCDTDILDGGVPDSVSLSGLTVSPGGVLYGTTSSLSPNQELVTIELGVGTCLATRVGGPSGFNKLAAAAFGPGGVLYGGTASNQQLIQFDTGSGVGTLIHDVFLPDEFCTLDALEFVVAPRSNDCNGNGIPDECDVAGGSSSDCNLDGRPDECESITDCNANAVPDACDIARGTSPDCQSNGIPDECDVAAGTGVLYAVQGGDCCGGRLYRVDPATAETTLVEDLELTFPSMDLCGPSGVTLSPDRLSLYITLNFEDAILRHEIESSQTTLVGHFDSASPSDLVFLSDGTLVVSDPSDDALYDIDPDTGADSFRCTTIVLDGQEVVPVRVSGLAVSPSGVLFGSVGGNSGTPAVPAGALLTIDPQPDPNLECLATLVGSGTGFNRLAGISFRSDGTLYGATARDLEMIRIDPVTGVGTLIDNFFGDPEICSIDGLQFVGGSADCNHNDVPDECDIAGGSSMDADMDGRPDECVPSLVFVDEDAEGSNDGTSWNDAFEELRVALAAAAASGGRITEIWVADGVYTPAPAGGSRAASFQLLDEITLRGGFRGDEDPATFNLADRDFDGNETVLSGDLNVNDGMISPPGDIADNSFHVVLGSGAESKTLLDGFTIRGGNADGPGNNAGGGIRTENGGPTITNCIFEGNRALFGGAMYNSAGSPEVTNCEFNNNMAGDSGGAVVNSAGSVPEFTSCQFVGNQAGTNAGGAILSNSGSQTTLTLCTFQDNIAGLNGGALAVLDGHVEMTDCNFSTNQAGVGGAVYQLNSTGEWTRCTLQSNTTTIGLERGGGLYAEGVEMTLTSCIFDGNTADLEGGGVYLLSGAMALGNCMFDGNIANNSDTGGGMVVDEATANFDGCHFNANMSPFGSAGALYNTNGGNVTLNDCHFNSNVANAFGGAIRTDSSVLNATDCTFTSNEGRDGGAVASFFGSPTFTRCTFTMNNNGNFGRGGAVYNDGSSPTYDQCVFDRNHATGECGEGGAMINLNDSGPRIQNCSFIGNVADARGGALQNELNSNPVIINSAFVNNQAKGLFGCTAAGGAINNESSMVACANCVFNGNNAANGPGGAIFDSQGGSLLINTTLVNNAATAGGGLFAVNGAPIIANSIFFNNFALGGGTAEAQQISGDAPIVNYSFIQGLTGQFGGTGNIGAGLLVPGFIDFDGPNDTVGDVDDDLDLASGSPCIDAGNSASVQFSVSTDFLGRPRFFDDPGTPDTGPGSPPIVDMGAYEFQDVTAQTTVFVDDSATGANNGTSWANAFTDLQSAFAAAHSPDSPIEQIWVAVGRYHAAPPAGPQTASFLLPDGVGVYGGFAGNESHFADRAGLFDQTILTGDIGNDDGDSSCCVEDAARTGCDDVACQQIVCGVDSACCNIAWDASCAANAVALCKPLCDIFGFIDNAYHVVTVVNAAENTILDGFKITGGRAVGTGPTESQGAGMYINSIDRPGPTLRNLTFFENTALADGGGLLVSGGNLFLDNLTFRENSAGQDGGGMRLDNGATAFLFSSHFLLNHADDNSGALDTVTGTPIILQGCNFDQNTAEDEAGAMDLSADATIADCTFTNNMSVAGDGGAITVDSGVVATLVRSQFGHNIALLNGGAVDVGGLGVISNCLFFSNSSNNVVGGGGGVNVQTGAAVDVYNSTFSGNTASGMGGGIATAGALIVTNTILWLNSASSGAPEFQQVHLFSGVGTVNHSCIQGLSPLFDSVFISAANIGQDPLFIDQSHGDLHLDLGSPCIDAGNSGVLAAPFVFNTDLDHAFRLLDDTNTPNTGIPFLDPPGIIDIGAYEYQFLGLGCSGGDEECDDGRFCNTTERCILGLGECVAGEPNCPDSSISDCNELADQCAAGCLTNIDCDDGIPCTIDVCVLPGGACMNTANHGFCDDGLFCNGLETCSPTLGCQPGADPCGGSNCDEIDGCGS